MDGAGDKVDRGGVQVIARAAAILRALEEDPSGLSLGDLAKRLGLPRSTIQRVVGALAEEQLVISAGQRAGITLGPALVRLAAAANIEVDRIARPILQALSRRLGETVDLSALQGRTANFVDQVVGASRLVAISAIGASFPLHCTANGKALLAMMAKERTRTLIAASLSRHRSDTALDASAVEREVDEVREHQLAYDLEEHSEGICAIGAGFIDPLGREYALSVPVPVTRYAGKREEIAEQLLASRDEIVRIIPGSRTSFSD